MATAEATYKPTGALLVGSLQAESVADVFKHACTALPGKLKRIPDGELGQRFYFVMISQRHVFPEQIKWALPAFPEDKSVDGYVCKKEDFGKPGYDTAALQSYEIFKQLKAEGTIPAHVKFQVSFPGAANGIITHVHQRYRADCEPIYEALLLEELANIQAQIPASELAIQLDIAVEVGMIEISHGLFESVFFNPWFPDVKKGTMERISRYTSAVHPDVDLGLHLCYGDIEHHHFVEPKDLGTVVDIANGIYDSGHHPITWAHMPVPKDRSDKAYFEPLARLKLDGELFLGLVHPHDEIGTLKKIEVARAVYGKTFGVATECGMGRTPPSDVDEIFRTMDAVCSAY